MLSLLEKEEQTRLPILDRLARLEDDVDELYSFMKETVVLLERVTDQMVKDKQER